MSGTKAPVFNPPTSLRGKVVDDMILGKGTFLPRTVKMTIDIYVQSLTELLMTVIETVIKKLMDSIKHSLYTYVVVVTEYGFQKKPNRLLLRKQEI